MQKSYVPMENTCCTAAADVLCFWRYTVGNNIGLWWHNFRANGKGGLWQLHSTSVIAHGSQDTREMSDKIFFTTSQIFCNPAVWAHLIYTTFLHLFTQNVRVKITLAAIKEWIQPNVSDPAARCHLVYTTLLHLFTQNIRARIMLTP